MAQRAKRYAGEGVGDFFPEGVGLFVQFSEAVEFGEVFDFYDYVIVHDYLIFFVRPRLNGSRNLTSME